MITSNLPHILHRFRDIAADRSEIAIFAATLVFNSPGGGFPWVDLRKVFSGCLRMAKVPNAVEILPKFQGEGVVPGEYFFGFYKTRHILLSNGANCTVLRAVVLTQYRRVTDGRTDGIAVANTALAMRALRAL